jgi:two-component system LytT family response regulator
VLWIICLKPIDKDDLVNALTESNSADTKTYCTAIAIADAETAATNKPYQQNCVTHDEGLQMVPVESILYCESTAITLPFILKNKQKIIVSRTLKEMEEILEDILLQGCTAPISSISVK